MSPHKGPNIIGYCVITSTLSLVVIALGQIPQFKVDKAKLLCAEYISQKDSMEGLKKGFKLRFIALNITEENARLLSDRWALNLKSNPIF